MDILLIGYRDVADRRARHIYNRLRHNGYQNHFGITLRAYRADIYPEFATELLVEGRCPDRHKHLRLHPTRGGDCSLYRDGIG